MSWPDFYLICFAVGFLLSFIGFLGSSLHLPHLHLHLHHVHAGHGQGGASRINFGTISAFLAWFGGAGYLFTRFHGGWFIAALAVAGVSGLAGAVVVFLFLAKVLLRHERPLDPADYEIIGVLGRVSSPVREGGTGEMIFLQEGARRCAAIRAENGHTISKNVEVVVTRFEKGIAYVKEWDTL